MIPLIGITTDYEQPGEFPCKAPGVGRFLLRDSYTTAIERAGGIPIMLPAISDPKLLIEKIDGLLVTGGNFDIPPELSGIPDPGKARKIIPLRTKFEMALIESALDRNIPVLGICGGMQLLAVLSGGKLYGDILEEAPGAFDHEQQLPPNECRHPVGIVQGTLLHRLVLKEQLGVNSTHHQAVADPGACVVAAWSIDGIIEAVERPDKYWALGVEWHPEHLSEKHESHAAIIRGFIRACIDRNRPAD